MRKCLELGVPRVPKVKDRALTPLTPNSELFWTRIKTEEAGKINTNVEGSGLELWGGEAFLLRCLYVPVLSA
jgi:hypothetical protein